MVMLYSYTVTRDYGFAPNPFYGICTLATCKPDIRSVAQVNDWVIGVGSKDKKLNEKYKMRNKLIYAMEVNEKITYDQYWTDKRFQTKKPVMNGSIKQFFGDNIYHKEDGKWVQVDSHHSYPDGKTNPVNLKTDTKSCYVLISKRFFYFGKEAIQIPRKFNIIYNVKRRHISRSIPVEIRNSFISWLTNNIDYEPGYHGDPFFFEEVKRYSSS